MDAMDDSSGEVLTRSLPRRMTAVVQHAYGEAHDVLRIEQADVPELEADRMLVEVVAAGVDRGVWHLMTGLPYPVRLAGFGVRAPKAGIRGSDVAGRVVAVGAAVTRFRPGEAVFGFGDGSFAQYVSCREDKLARKPDAVSFEQAAAVPVSGLTALQGLRDHASIAQGARVLVLGAAGGVGSFGVQIARSMGAEVTGVASTAKLDVVRDIGADHVLDYTVDDPCDGSVRYDVILDTGGNTSLRRLRRALAPRGTLVLVGAETGGRWLGGTDRALRALVLNPFLGHDLHPFIASETSADLEAMADLLERGIVVPAVERAFPLAEAAAAVEHLHGGLARGKVVLTVTRDDGTTRPN